MDTRGAMYPTKRSPVHAVQAVNVEPRDGRRM